MSVEPADVVPEKPRQAKRGRGRPTLSNEELLDRTLDLFLKHGFEGTSIDAITVAAGVAKRTIYARYGDKNALFMAALERAIEEWMVPIERLRALESGNLERTLQDIARVLIGNIMTPAGQRLLKITNAEAGRRPEIGVFNYKHGTEQTVQYLADLFRRRIGSIAVPANDWSEAAIAFLNSVVSAPPSKTAWGLTFNEESVERHIAFTVRLFLFGLTPRDEMREGKAKVCKPAARPGRQADVDGASSARLRELEEENQQLRQLLVDAMLENASAGLGARSGVIKRK